VKENTNKIARAGSIPDTSVNTATRGMGTYAIYLLIVLVLGYFLFIIVIPPPVASFSSDVSSGKAPYIVQFSDTSQGNVNSWQWDFGDGSSSTDQNPSHEYTEARSYAVRLTALGPKGSDEVNMQDAINVNPGPLAEVLVTPTEITLEVQDTAQIVAKAFDQFGNEISDVVFTWGVRGQGGSIDEGGLFLLEPRRIPMKIF
jgi:PKD repeat protein